MANAILNFHFDYLNPSLIDDLQFVECGTCHLDFGVSLRGAGVQGVGRESGREVGAAGAGFIKIKRPLNLIYGLCINTLSRNSVLTNKAGPPHKMSQFGVAFENVMNAFLLGGAK